MDGGNNTGGLVGYAIYGNILNSYAAGAVNGSNGTGGLVGNKANTLNSVTNSYATGSVSGSVTNIGGLIGMGSTVNVISSYWDTQTSGQIASIGGTGKTTDQMYQQSTYVDWDFASVWNINKGKSYPWLRSIDHEIKNCAELQDIQQNLSSAYRLVADIYCKGVAFSPIGTYQQPFIGSLDGDKYIIHDLTIQKNNQPFVSLFSATKGAHVIELALKNVNVVGQRIVGSLIGYAFDGTQIADVSADGNVASNASGEYYIGGLIGVLFDGTIDRSLTAVTVNAPNAHYIGGLVGQNNSAISNSYSLSAVNGAAYVRGFAGDNSGIITNTYSSGKVTATNSAGGLIASNSGGDVSSSYWDTQTSGQSTSAGGTGKSTADMYKQNTYVGWDFTNVWHIFNGHTYPWLKNQVIQVQDQSAH